MLNRKIEFLILCLIVLIVGSCDQITKHENNCDDTQLSKRNRSEVIIEVEKWEKELLENRQIGSAFNYQSFDSLVHEKWRKNNPDQMDGLPFDDTEIKSVRSDFNNDNKEDLLLYFQAENCTGHNGSTKTYAKIIYSDGTSKSDLMNDIISAIQAEYGHRRKINKNLKEITSSYLETSTTINGCHNGIIGEFRLYTKDDAHCCPSYNGIYTYKFKGGSMEIEITDNNK